MMVIAMRKLSQSIKAFGTVVSATSKNFAQITEGLNAMKEDE